LQVFNQYVTRGKVRYAKERREGGGMSNRLSLGVFWGMCVALLIFMAAWIVGFTELAIYMKGEGGVSKATENGMVATLAIAGLLITIGWWAWFIFGFKGLLKVTVNPRLSLGRFIPLALLLTVFTAGWVAGILAVEHYNAQISRSIEGATAALVISGLSIAVGWICWFVYGFRYIYHAEDRSFA
jgi:hypothetical protein